MASKNVLLNNHKETTVVAAAIDATFTQIIDLYKVRIFEHMEIQSTLNREVQIRFDDTGDTLTVPSNRLLVRDGFLHHDKISLRYTGEKPTSGSIIITSW